MARQSREAWARRVRRWEKSGLGASDFAALEGVNAKTLSYWKWKLGASGVAQRRKPPPVKPARASFVEVIAEDAPQYVPGAGEVVVERERVRVRCGGAVVGEVLAALRGQR